MAKTAQTQVLSKHMLHFEASARHLNFTAAANELEQSQPAVSHSIRVLEKQLETQLFKRLHRGVQLTQEGQLLFDVVTNGIDAIEQVLEFIKNLRTSHSHRALSLQLGALV